MHTDWLLLPLLYPPSQQVFFSMSRQWKEPVSIEYQPRLFSGKIYLHFLSISYPNEQREVGTWNREFARLLIRPTLPLWSGQVVSLVTSTTRGKRTITRNMSFCLAIITIVRRATMTHSRISFHYRRRSRSGGRSRNRCCVTILVSAATWRVSCSMVRTTDESTEEGAETTGE